MIKISMTKITPPTIAMFVPRESSFLLLLPIGFTGDVCVEVVVFTAVT